MESAVILYFYTEISQEDVFSNMKKPFVLSKIAGSFANANQNIFKLCGGLQIIDYFKTPHVHIRISLWKNAAGYKSWSEHPNTEAYIKARSQYQEKNNIEELIEGPFGVSQND